MIGPVGLALTNSTFTRSGVSASPAPKRSPAASSSASASRYQASVMNRLRKPGPATSTRSTASPSRSPSASPSRSAIARGGVAQRRGEQHRRVGGVVAEVGLRRPVELRRGSEPSPSAAAAALTASRELCGSESALISVVVGLAGQDLVCTVELLEQNHARELVRAASSARATAASRPPGRGRAGPPITKHTSRPSRRRSSSQAAERAPSPAASPSLASSTCEARSGIRAAHLLVLAHLDHLHPRMAGRSASGSAPRRPGKAAASGRPRLRRSASALRYYARARGRRAPFQHPHRSRHDGGALRQLRQRVALRLRVHDHVRARGPRGRRGRGARAWSCRASASRRASCAS